MKAAATNASFSGLCGVCVDKYGNIYIAQWINDVIQKIDTNGILTRFAGTGSYGLSGDGGPATAAELELYVTVGIVADSMGNIYFADGEKIRKVNTSGTITTIAGNGSYGYSGDGGLARDATFAAPVGLCFDRDGNLYIADEQNSNIRKVNTSGIISTFAGTTTGFSGDGGPATSAKMTAPEGITSDDSGNIYFVDPYPRAGRVRKINTSGIITTIAGGDTTMAFYTACWGCPATALRLGGAIGVAVDHSGNIYASAISDNMVQKITQSGLAYTIAGNDIAGYSGDGGPASDATLNSPKMVCLDNSGNLLITDAGNHRLRKVWIGITYVPPAPVKVTQFSVYPNPITAHNFTCKITADTNEEASIIIRNVVGQQVFRNIFYTNTAAEFFINVPPSMYFITATIKGHKWNEKVVVE